MTLKPENPSKITYGKQTIDDADIAAVIEAMRSPWLTTGPRVGAFEQAFAEYVGQPHAVAVTNGTAALHCAMAALEIGPGDEVIVPTMTFAATANAVVFQGGTPVFCDVRTEDLLIDVRAAERLITAKTKAIASVDYAGQPARYTELRALADAHKLALVSDACHGLGATWMGKPPTDYADLATYSFHPVKPITTGEGGMIVTARAELAERMRRFRNHGISTDHRQREAAHTWFYEMQSLGYNYRLSDILCALGTEQLKRYPAWLDARRALAKIYDERLQAHPLIRPLTVAPEATHAYHLYVVRIQSGLREAAYRALLDDQIFANLHYIPVHLHPYYQKTFGTRAGLCPVAEAAYSEILTLPIHPGLTPNDIHRVCDRLMHATNPKR